ncbi:MAG: hypothetical protein CFH21_00908 [Alphaproteobacteria bacterium MarineAlpha5_Bin11]|nr:MAG: hypothetical protein CFH21_00908 [Alphaproteobacteria bacterium MarineAlpha5_Bin11]
MKKIEIYLLNQILKSFFLIFFIFTGISWLLQATRLIYLVTLHKIPLIKVFILSIYIIPNIITNILPFIIFFSILLTSIKLYRDKELISAYSLGVSARRMVNPFLIFISTMFVISLGISYYISPYYYNNFKKNEYNLRTNLDIENIGLGIFYNINENTVINFEKDSNNIKNFLIYQNDTKNIIIAKKTEMEISDNKLDLKLFEGYKTQIKESSYETLIYDKYNFSINLDTKEEYNSYDTNTFNLNRLLAEKNKKNYLIINQRLVDSLLLLTITYLILKFLIINLNFNAGKILSISIVSVIIIFFDNILGNLSINNVMYISLMYLNIFFPFFLNIFKFK